MCWQLRSTQLMRLITESTNQAWLEQHGLWPPLGPAARLDVGQETVSHRRTGSQVAPQRFPIQSCRKRLQCSRRTVPCRPPTLNASGKFPAPAAQKWRNKVNEWLTTARRSCFPLGENETRRDHLAVSHHCPALLQVCLASGALDAVQTDARAGNLPDAPTDAHQMRNCCPMHQPTAKFRLRESAPTSARDSTPKSVSTWPKNDRGA